MPKFTRFVPQLVKVRNGFRDFVPQLVKVRNGFRDVVPLQVKDGNSLRGFVPLQVKAGKSVSGLTPQGWFVDTHLRKPMSFRPPGWMADGGKGLVYSGPDIVYIGRSQSPGGWIGRYCSYC